MSLPQVLYEAKLAKEGRKLTYAGLAVITVWTAAGVVLCFGFTSFPESLLPFGLFAVGTAGFSVQTRRMMRLRQNPGYYRISIDDHGLYVHSDDPAFPSFSVIAPDVSRLVRKTIKGYDSSDDHEYYVETKSGTRHRIAQLFADYDLNVMQLFEKITERFHWVQILEETKP